MATPTAIETAINLITTDSEKLHAVVHGPVSGAGSTVTVDSGTVPSVAKAISDLAAAIVVGYAAGFVAKAADSSARALVTPNQAGQLLIQLDTKAIYYSSSTAMGDWTIHPVMLAAAAAEANALAATIARMPAGIYVPFAGSTIPAGWLLCYGQPVSRTTYADLFAAIGTTYGIGDGTTTFNLPDMRGRVVAGKDNMGGSAASRLTNTGVGHSGLNGETLGAAGGSDRHQLTTAQMPAHTHSAYLVVMNINGAGSHPSAYAPNSATTTGSTGGDQAHPNVQPTMIGNYIIRT